MIGPDRLAPGRHVVDPAVQDHVGDAVGAFEDLARDVLVASAVQVELGSSVDRAPFFAYPMICGCCFTFGGLKINTEAEVLDADGSPIRGLYVAGEAMGLYYGRYPGGTSVLRGAVFGRIAGVRAAASATLKLPAPNT